MRIARYGALAALCLSLQGCWFVFIPLGLLKGSGDPYYCVSPAANVGDKIKMTDGREATVTALHGTYDKCEHDYPGRFPIKADLTF